MNNCTFLGTTCDQILLQIIMGVVFTTIGVFVALWYSDIGKASLRFELMQIDSRLMEISGPNGKPIQRKVRFPHVMVFNRPRRAWLVTSRTAYDCNGIIEFLNVDTRTPIHKIAMPISWSDNPEPVKHEFNPKSKVLQGIADPSLERSRRFMNIPPNHGEPIDIAGRFVDDGKDDEVAFGWTPKCYYFGWRHPEFVIPQGEFIARITITTGDQEFHQEYLLKNPDVFDHFDLYPLFAQ